jgi:hypothetical protein
MAQKKITQEYLEKHVWWWKAGAMKHPCDFNKSPFDLETPVFLPPIYSLGFNYELARRAKQVAESPVRLASFTELGPSHLWIIGPFLGVVPIFQLASRDAGNAQQNEEKGWTRLFPKRQWNLQVSDRTLIKAFKVWVQGQRTTEGIPPPRPLAGTSKRKLPWRWLELLDLREYDLEKLSDSERHSLTLAQRASKRQEMLFDEAIDQYWETHTSPEDDEDSD